MSYQDRISPYNISTMSIRQVMNPPPLNLGAFAPKKIRSVHSTEALHFCHQCRELHQRLRSVGVYAVT